MAIAEVIKYESDNQTFIWKHPAEDFNTLSQLIVHESQEAVFFVDGKAMDSFGPGRYTLHTQNIPILRNLLELATGGVSPFHAEVYFVNLTEQPAIKWGTDSKVTFQDPTNNDYPFPIGASGELSLRAGEPWKLITKLVGTADSLDQERLMRALRAPIMTHVKTFLPRVLRERGISIFELDQYLNEFSRSLRELVSEEMADYGVVLEKFWITNLVKPEDDPFYQKMRELTGAVLTRPKEAELQQQVDLIGHTTQIQKGQMETDLERYRQQALGYSYQQKEGFEVMKRMAESGGAGGDVAGSMMGVGMGLHMGSAMGQMARSTLGDLSAQEAPGAGAPGRQEEPAGFCPDCGSPLATGDAFCSGCGAPVRGPAPACASCGHVFTNDKPFCPKCGTKRG